MKQKEPPQKYRLGTISNTKLLAGLNRFIYGPKSSGATTLLSANGNTLLTDKEAILKRWAEHSNSVLNRPSSINEDAIGRLPQIECNVLLDEFPTVMETRKAVQQLSSGKAPGADAIPADVYEAGCYPWQRH